MMMKVIELKVTATFHTKENDVLFHVFPFHVSYESNREDWPRIIKGVILQRSNYEDIWVQTTKVVEVITIEKKEKEIFFSTPVYNRHAFILK